MTHICIVRSSKLMTRGSTVFLVHNNYFVFVRNKSEIQNINAVRSERGINM